ncbi:hypothetical protein M885DRAFT_619958 [Pelagophyceae sp. CCMP2097]|nr:hypothetical protein M885DRAFT_619958 [Pelagophyceae sp. CCMP2097]
MLNAAKFSNETTASAETLKPTLAPTWSHKPVNQPTPKPSISPRPTRAPITYTAAPSDAAPSDTAPSNDDGGDDDDGGNDGPSWLLIATFAIVLFLAALNVGVVAMLAFQHCGGVNTEREARVVPRLASRLLSLKKKKSPEAKIGAGARRGIPSDPSGSDASDTELFRGRKAPLSPLRRP